MSVAPVSTQSLIRAFICLMHRIGCPHESVLHEPIRLHDSFRMSRSPASKPRLPLCPSSAPHLTSQHFDCLNCWITCMSCNRLCSASCVCAHRFAELSGSGAADRAASAIARWPRMLQKRSSCVLVGSLSRRPCLTRRSSGAFCCAGMAPIGACASNTLLVCKGSHC